jgi:hypothetical protein
MHDDKKTLPTARADGSLTSRPQSQVSQAQTFLDDLKKRRPVSSGRLIFALDATLSRQPTWDAASARTAPMFQEAGTIGGLQMQLVFFRGDVLRGCEVRGWFSDPQQLTREMEKITCITGPTRIGKVLDHVLKETKLLKVSALVFVGDALEVEGGDDPDKLAGKAAELGRLGVPAFMFQEGNDPIAERTFEEIARLTGGAYCPFDPGSAHQLGELLRAVARVAVGGPKALEGRKDAGSVKLLTQMKKGGQQ